jgi:hypothetical protein
MSSIWAQTVDIIQILINVITTLLTEGARETQRVGVNLDLAGTRFDSGRAIAQAVSRRLPTAAARVQNRVWSCGILCWTKVALGQVFPPENFGFPCQSTFHLLLHNHLHYHPRLAQ